MTTAQLQSAELHLNILATQIKRLEGNVRAALLKKDMEGEDKEKQELIAQGFEEQIKTMEEQRDAYENEILKRTSL